MKWGKLGRIYVPDGKSDWANTHAAVPFAEHITDDIFRIYFGSRDRSNCSTIGYVDIDIKDPKKIIKTSEDPLLTKGELGTFDDSGTMPSWIINIDEKKYLYYIGWNLGVTVPFRNSLGLAISYDKGEHFQRYSKAPIIDRSIYDPCFVASACILKNPNSHWKMWYLSCIKWIVENNVPKHYYHIKYAESIDGINWVRNGQVAIDFISEKEYAISRPSVIQNGKHYKMWYSYRGNERAETYRIGYAESEDGVKWIRKDEDNEINVSTSGWDSEMLCYPFVFDHKGNRYMLYNGNGYGKTGFGLAILEKD